MASQTYTYILDPITLRPTANVQGNNTEGQEATANRLPASVLDDAREVRLGRPGLDGFGQVDVGFGVARDPRGDLRQNVQQVATVDHVGRLDRQAAEFGDDQPALRLGDPVQLLEGGLGVSDVAQAERDRDRVERLVLEGQAQRVTGGERSVRVLLLARGQHADREIAGDDVGARFGEGLR